MVRFDPEQLAASLYDDYHGACGPLGLQRLPVMPTSAVHSALLLGQVVFRCPYHVDGVPDHQLQRVG
jgi:hypothetical protein